MQELLDYAKSFEFIPETMEKLLEFYNQMIDMTAPNYSGCRERSFVEAMGGQLWQKLAWEK